ncbi:MAG: protein-disulfide reductase DsbD family protein, partial [Boseongicola sp.]|nr:protein-disulfide reductase DsbD family protein [Boseongicola sp.]
MDDREVMIRSINIRSSIFYAMAAVTVFSVASGSASAQTASPWAEADKTAVRLISATNSVGDSEQVKLGLHFRMKDGWKVYWRSAGDAGYPPKLDWSTSENIDGAAMSWPAPERFQILGFNTLGYRDEVVLPLDVKLKQAGESTLARIAVDYLTCKEICIPIVEELALSLP